MLCEEIAAVHLKMLMLDNIISQFKFSATKKQAKEDEKAKYFLLAKVAKASLQFSCAKVVDGETSFITIILLEI